MSATAPTSLITPSAARTRASGDSAIWRIVQRTFASTAALSCASGGSAARRQLDLEQLLQRAEL